MIIGNWFQIAGAVTEKARLPILSFIFGTKGCLETDYLRVLEISEKCSRLIKYVGCWVERVPWYTIYWCVHKKLAVTSSTGSW